jgi:hypothetical protein
MLLKLPWQIPASLLDRIKALGVVGVVNQVLSESANEGTKKSGKRLLARLGQHTDGTAPIGGDRDCPGGNPRARWRPTDMEAGAGWRRGADGRKGIRTRSISVRQKLS